jgi:hypothetical protein
VRGEDARPPRVLSNPISELIGLELEVVEWQYRCDKELATFVLADTNTPLIRKVNRPRSILAIPVFLIQTVPSVIANGSIRTPIAFLKEI